MTTIVIDCANQTVYTDTLTTTSHNVTESNILRLLAGLEPKSKESDCTTFSSGKHVKAVLKDDSTILTACGDVATWNAFRAGYPDNIPEPESGCKVIAITKKGNVCNYTVFETKEITTNPFFGRSKTRYEWEHKTFTKKSGYITMGSGGEFAFGAIEAGLPPTEAIGIAATLDENTGSYVDVTTFPDKED